MSSSPTYLRHEPKRRVDPSRATRRVAVVFGPQEALGWPKLELLHDPFEAHLRNVKTGGKHGIIEGNSVR